MRPARLGLLIVLVSACTTGQPIPGSGPGAADHATAQTARADRIVAAIDAADLGAAKAIAGEVKAEEAAHVKRATAAEGELAKARKRIADLEAETSRRLAWFYGTLVVVGTLGLILAPLAFYFIGGAAKIAVLCSGLAIVLGLTLAKFGVALAWIGAGGALVIVGILAWQFLAYARRVVPQLVATVDETKPQLPTSSLERLFTGPAPRAALIQDSATRKVVARIREAKA